MDNVNPDKLRDYQNHPVDPDIDTLEFSEHLSEGQVLTLKRLLSKYRKAFAFQSGEIGCTDLVKFDIELEDDTPYATRPYRVSRAERKEIDRQIRELLDNGIIEPSNSPWAAPVILIRESDGTYRLAVDTRILNSKTKKIVYVLPRQDKSFDAFVGFKYASFFDFLSAFHQIKCTQRAKECSGFVTPVGSFVFRQMTFGSKGAPKVYQDLMLKLLGKMAWESAVCFIDDLGVIGKTIESHNDNLEILLHRIIVAKLTLKPKKCKFAEISAKYLGHIISREGISTDPEKVASIINFPVPQNLSQSRGFAQLCSFYRKFVKDFSSICAPLYELTKKNKKNFLWSDECQIAFEDLKTRLASASILSHFNEDAESIQLYTDASGIGLGAMLTITVNKEEKLVSFYSRNLNKAEANYHTTEQEALAIVTSVEYFRPYLYAREFKVVTDHCSLCNLMTCKSLKGRLCRWAL
ncbi:unnamed protein product [Allacma fusca]|uniref:RNA-directed DNA polymerase n=1 Tax=Allacma fusca TaxID=39272 RepID=A0A8J2PR30_9HEXA|nr:unnamed protein product [Allacma fusca]